LEEEEEEEEEEELEVSIAIVDLTIAKAVLLATRSGASKTDICDRQFHN
jgi:hypothetical protein